MLKAKEELMGILYKYLQNHGWHMTIGGVQKGNARIWIEPDTAAITLRIATRDITVATRISSRNVAVEKNGTLYIGGSYEKIEQGKAGYIIRDGKEFHLKGVHIKIQG